MSSRTAVLHLWERSMCPKKTTLRASNVCHHTINIGRDQKKHRTRYPTPLRPHTIRDNVGVPRVTCNSDTVSGGN